MTLLDLLNARYSTAKNYTKKFQDEVKKCVEDYKCEKDYSAGVKDATVTNKHLSIKRYELPIPYIYSTHESMLSSLIEKPPELLFSGKGAKDENKAEIVKAIYKYLFDKLDLEEFLNTSAWWFILVGFVSSYQKYEIKIKGYQPVLDSQGQPMIDETGEPITTPIYEWNDPMAYVDNPMKVYFSPDSEFSNDATNCSYIFREKLRTKEEMIETYNITKQEDKDKLEASETLAVEGLKTKSDDEKNDIKRVKCLYYCGTIPEENKDELKVFDEKLEWSANKTYSISLTDTKIYNIEEEDKRTTLAKWFGEPNSFFGFGIGKTLRSQQKEMSIRRGQQVRYADLYAFPQLAVDGKTTIDQNALQDYQKRKPLVFNGQPPFYITPPSMPNTLVQADQTSRSDAQFISGTLDLSKGAQESNTVKTATGQTLFAQSQDKRIQKARKALGKYFKYVMKNLFELARDNWDEEKVISITDEDGNEVNYKVKGETLNDINFDTDIDFQLENIMINKEVLAQRWIDFYDKVKDDPLVNRKKIFGKMAKEGFSVKNPDSYLLKEGEEGTQPKGNSPKDLGLPPETPINNSLTPNEQSMGGNQGPENGPVISPGAPAPQGQPGM